MTDHELGEALLAFFKNPVDLPSLPDAATPGEVWCMEEDGWLYPWRITGPKAGYPCGEPVAVGSVLPPHVRVFKPDEKTATAIIVGRTAGGAHLRVLFTDGEHEGFYFAMLAEHGRGRDDSPFTVSYYPQDQFCRPVG